MPITEYGEPGYVSPTLAAAFLTRARGERRTPSSASIRRTADVESAGLTRGLVPGASIIYRRCSWSFNVAMSKADSITVVRARGAAPLIDEWRAGRTGEPALVPLDDTAGESTAPGASCWSPGTAFARCRTVLRERGLRELLGGVAGELGYRRLLLLELRLADGRWPSARNACRFEPGVIEDHSEYRRLRGDLDGPRFDDRIAAGARALCVREDGEPIGVTWARRGSAPLPYLGATVVAARSTFLFDTFVRPDRRGRGASPAILTGWREAFMAVGTDRIVVGVLPENRSSRRSRARFGFTPFAVAYRLGLAGRARLGVRPLLPGEGRTPR